MKEGIECPVGLGLLGLARALLLLEGEEVHKQHDRRVSENVRHGAIAVQVLLHLPSVFAQAMRRAEVLGGTGPGHALEGPEVMYVSFGLSASDLPQSVLVTVGQGSRAGFALLDDARADAVPEVKHIWSTTNT